MALLWANHYDYLHKRDQFLLLDDHDGWTHPVVVATMVRLGTENIGGWYVFDDEGGMVGSVHPTRLAARMAAMDWYENQQEREYQRREEAKHS